MKKLFIMLTAAALVCGANQAVFAQADPGLVAKFVDEAKVAKDGQLGTIASELTGKVQAFGASIGANDAIKGKLDDMLKSLTGGRGTFSASLDRYDEMPSHLAEKVVEAHKKDTSDSASH